MIKKEVIKKTEEYVKKILKDDRTGHDWWHADRVRKTAVNIGRLENADLFVVELAALLHDIADWKFNSGDDSAGPNLARKWLEGLGVEQGIINHVCEIAKDISFKGSNVKSAIRTKEGMIVQDADRLDAMGAVGIARAFGTGAKFNEIFYDPMVPVPKYKSAKEYINAKGKKGRTTINHFYEKLLFLRDLMNTKTAKKIAAQRHKFMEQFLDRFLKEWEGKI